LYVEVTCIVIAIIIFRRFNLKKKILDREKKQIKITISCTGLGSDKKMGGICPMDKLIFFVIGIIS
jgi:hypothetical protein